MQATCRVGADAVPGAGEAVLRQDEQLLRALDESAQSVKECSDAVRRGCAGSEGREPGKQHVPQIALTLVEDCGDEPALVAKASVQGADPTPAWAAISSTVTFSTPRVANS
jgi:hypothetical protein